MSGRVPVRFAVNGEVVEAEIGPETLLIDFLRDHLGLTGTKEGCGVGVCGACTVLLDDRPVSACLLLTVLCDGRHVWTVEGLTARMQEAGGSAPVQGPVALQQTFVAREGLQCGICTPGQVVAAYALLQQNPRPRQEEIVEWMAGNLCRCTGYLSILRSILAASGEEAGEEDGLL